MTSVRRRILTAQWSTLIPLAVVSATGIAALRVTTDAFDDTAETYRAATLPLSRVHTDVLTLSVAGFEYAAARTPAAGAEFQATIDTVEARIDALIDHPVTGPAEERHLATARAAIAEAGAVVDDAVAGGRTLPQTPGGVEAYAAAIEAATGHVLEAEGLAEASAERALADARAVERRVTVLVAATVVIGAIAAWAVALRLSRALVTPIGALRWAAERFAAGELEHRVSFDRTDELGALGNAFDAMAEHVATTREELAHQAFHDRLTGLANRALLHDRTQHALDRLGRSGGRVAVLVLDLDEFKSVNDTLGHAAGDELLRLTAARIAEVLRRSDTAARLGGDEFAVLVEDLDRVDQADELAARMNARLREPVVVGGREVTAKASIGVALGTAGDEAEDLLRNADLAMYAAKERGKDRWMRFEARMHDEAVERLNLEEALRRAIERDQLVLHYQPTIDISTGTLAGFEALVRWNHPERGMVAPGDFIPLAEATGLVVPLGWWVLDTACAQAAAWRTTHPHLELDMSVNLSARQLQEDDLVVRVEEALARTGLPARRLVLEITESAMMADAELARVRMSELHRVGVRIAIDDFGTGYSSLAYLQDFAVDVLKIDKSFVDGILGGRSEPAMVEAIIALARALRLETVAEGIEEPPQRDAMLVLGCSLAQGYLFDRPMPADAVASRLDDHAEWEARWRATTAATATGFRV